MKPEKHVWEAWIGQKVTECYSLDDGMVYIELEDGRGVTFASGPLNYTCRVSINPIGVAETTLGTKTKRRNAMPVPTK